MEITILGSGTCVPYARRSSPCTAVDINGRLALLDSGSGSMLRLTEAKLDHTKIDHLFYTHFHPDHTADMIPILFAMKNTPGFQREKDITITGPRGFSQVYETRSSLYERWINSPYYQIHLREVASSKAWEAAYDGFLVRSMPVLHSKNSVGYRVEEGGKALVFSGDTDYCESLIELARDADMLILECSTPDSEKVEGHLTPTLAGKIAAESKCRKLVLTHLYPACDQTDILTPLKKEYQGEAVVAEDLMKFTL